MHKPRTLTFMVLLVFALAIGATPTTTSSSTPSSSSYPIIHNATIYRDNWGVPHIYAERTSDAYYAWGYAMAQDRMFEMDIHRRAVAGRLSEWFGDQTLEQDMLMRTLGIYKIANDTWNGILGPGVSLDVIEYLKYFSAGVNQYVAEWPDGTPLEYNALKAMDLPWRPYPWTPPDCLAIAGMMGLMLTDTSEQELIRGAFMQNVESLIPGITDFLMPTGWINMTTIMPPDCPGDKGFGGVKAVTEPLGELLGFSGLDASNNWVIDDNKSATGHAILCNDPHLNLQTPGINWQVHVKTDDFNVIGCCIPGGPVVYTGHNDYMAFGVTNLMTDVLDLYYYVSNTTHYWYVDHWEPFTVRYETVYNLSDPITLPVLSTRHGPLISIPGVGTYAFRWCGMEKGYGEVEGFSKMMGAKNLTDWIEALTHMSVIIQNYVYADKEGNIAWWPSGAIPIRDPTDGTMGVVPSNGSAGQNEWIGWVPHDDMPHSINPKQHFIVTANNQPAGPDSGYYPYPWIGPAYTFDPGYRAERITELINNKTTLDVNDMIAIQADSLSIPARILTPYITNAYTKPIADPWINKTIEFLESWDYKALRNSVAALIFEIWLEKFGNNTFFDEFGAYGLYPFPNAIIPLRNMTEGYPTSPFSAFLFDNKSTTGITETRDDIIKKSLNDTINWLKSQFGSTDPSNMTTWQYGALHKVQFEHTMGSVLPFLNIPPTPVGCDGDPFTVDPGGHHHKLIVVEVLYVESGASYRGIYECKDNWDTSLILVPPGESGLVTGLPPLVPATFSPHYNDTFLLWLNNQYTPCLFNDTEIQTYPKTVLEFPMIFPTYADVYRDGKIDMMDITITCYAFASFPGHPRWNPDADTDEDGKVDMMDVATICYFFLAELDC